MRNKLMTQKWTREEMEAIDQEIEEIVSAASLWKQAQTTCVILTALLLCRQYTS